ncbi:hypothetical protein SNEBB_004484 [Seison nebaliae]|nr:hypothetical protein SNEBB_004484 [Seison nebaliae]
MKNNGIPFGIFLGNLDDEGKVSVEYAKEMENHIDELEEVLTNHQVGKSKRKKIPQYEKDDDPMGLDLVDGISVDDDEEDDDDVEKYGMVGNHLNAFDGMRMTKPDNVLPKKIGDLTVDRLFPHFSTANDLRFQKLFADNRYRYMLEEGYSLYRADSMNIIKDDDDGWKRFNRNQLNYQVTNGVLNRVDKSNRRQFKKKRKNHEEIMKSCYEKNLMKVFNETEELLSDEDEDFRTENIYQLSYLNMKSEYENTRVTRKLKYGGSYDPKALDVCLKKILQMHQQDDKRSDYALGSHLTRDGHVSLIGRPSKEQASAKRRRRYMTKYPHVSDEEANVSAMLLWRFGPSEYWFDQIGMPKTIEGMLDYYESLYIENERRRELYEKEMSLKRIIFSSLFEMAKKQAEICDKELFIPTRMDIKRLLNGENIDLMKNRKRKNDEKFEEVKSKRRLCIEDGKLFFKENFEEPSNIPSNGIKINEEKIDKKLENRLNNDVDERNRRLREKEDEDINHLLTDDYLDENSDSDGEWEGKLNFNLGVKHKQEHALNQFKRRLPLTLNKCTWLPTGNLRRLAEYVDTTSTVPSPISVNFQSKEQLEEERTKKMNQLWFSIFNLSSLTSKRSYTHLLPENTDDDDELDEEWKSRLMLDAKVDLKQLHFFQPKINLLNYFDNNQLQFSFVHRQDENRVGPNMQLLKTNLELDKGFPNLTNVTGNNLVKLANHSTVVGTTKKKTEKLTKKKKLELEKLNEKNSDQNQNQTTNNDNVGSDGRIPSIPYQLNYNEKFGKLEFWNYSNDIFYQSSKNSETNSMTSISKTDLNVLETVKHPHFVLELPEQLFPMFTLTLDLLRNFYRQPFHALPEMFPVRMLMERSNRYSSKQRGILKKHRRKKRDLTQIEQLTGKEGEIILMEFCEQFPPIMIQPGMVSSINNYYQRKPGYNNGEDSVHSKYGRMVYLLEKDVTSVLGRLKAGESLQCLENSLYRAAIYQHRKKTRDFLLIRRNNQFFLRRFDAQFVVGQTFPLKEVPAPVSKPIGFLSKEYIQVYLHRLFTSCSKYNGTPLVKTLVQLNVDADNWWLFRSIPTRNFQPPSTPGWANDVIKGFDNLFRRKLRSFAEYDKETTSWKLKEENINFPDEDEICSMLTPETICLFYSMMVHRQRLKDMGYTEQAITGRPTNEKGGIKESKKSTDKNNPQIIEREVRCSPWMVSEALCDMVKSRAILDILGPTDPTGCRKGFSLSKIPTKQSRRDDEGKKDKANRISVTGTDADLRKLHLQEAKNVLKTLGITEEEINTMTRWRIIQLIRHYSNEENLDRANIPEAEKDFLRKYVRKPSGRVSHSELSTKMWQDIQTQFEVQNRDLSNPIEPETEPESDQDDLESLEKKLTNAHRNKSLRIVRIFINGNERTERIETINNSKVIDAYIRMKKMKTDEELQAFVMSKEEKQKRLKDLRSYRLDKRMLDKPGTNTTGGQYHSPKVPDSSNDKLKRKDDVPPVKPPKKTVRCSVCQQVGHTKTNQACPLYGKDPKPKEKVQNKKPRKPKAKTLAATANNNNMPSSLAVNSTNNNQNIKPIVRVKHNNKTGSPILFIKPSSPSTNNQSKAKRLSSDGTHSSLFRQRMSSSASSRNDKSPAVNSQVPGRKDYQRSMFLLKDNIDRGIIKNFTLSHLLLALWEDVTKLSVIGNLQKPPIENKDGNINLEQPSLLLDIEAKLKEHRYQSFNEFKMDIQHVHHIARDQYDLNNSTIIAATCIQNFVLEIYKDFNELFKKFEVPVKESEDIFGRLSDSDGELD